MNTQNNKPGSFLEEQGEDPTELCHFDIIYDEVDDSDDELSYSVEFDKAFLGHVFSCFEATGNPEALGLLENLGLARTEDRAAAFDALMDSDISGYAWDNEEAWRELAGFYIKAGSDAYVSENMMEIY